MKKYKMISEMSLWEKVVTYWNGPLSNIKNYLNNSESAIEIIAFGFLSIIYAIFWAFKDFIFPIIAFFTCPIWIIPYCIFYNKKKRKGADKYE